MTCRRCGATYEGRAQSRFCSDVCRAIEKRDQMRAWRETHGEHAPGHAGAGFTPVDPAEVAWVHDVPEVERTLFVRLQALPAEVFERRLNRLLSMVQGGITQ